MSAEEHPRGFVYEPTYEEEVVMLFGRLIPDLRDDFLIYSFSGAFPDCIADRNGQRVEMEFELYSSHFFAHHHDRDEKVKDCDLLVCWKNDTPYRTERRGGKVFMRAGNREIEVIALDEVVRSLDGGSHKIIIRGKSPKLEKVNRQTFFEQLEKNAPQEKFHWIKQLHDWAAECPQLEIRWGGGKRLYTMRFYVKRWNVDPIFITGNGSVAIQYAGNPSISPWELPPETQSKLRQIFGHKNQKWPDAPLRNEGDFENLKKALQISIEDSESSDLVWHQR
jgi:hypothetical protein